MSILIKQAGVISTADFLRLFVKTIIGVLLARILTQTDYGTYRQLFMIYTLLSSIFMLGLPQSIYYYIPKSDPDTRKRFIKQTIDLATILGILSTFALLLTKNAIASLFNNPNLSLTLTIYAIYPFCMFLSQIYYSIMLGCQNIKKAAYFIILAVVLDFVLIIGIALLTQRLNYILLGVIISVLIQWIYARISLVSYSYNESIVYYDKSLLSQQLKFSLPIGVAALVGVISAQMDKVIISSYLTPELFAVFSIGATELPFMGIIINSVNAVILPEMSKYKDADSISALYKGAIRKNALILFPIFALCMIYAPQIITILYSDKYITAVPIFRFYLLTIPLRIATYGLLFQVYNKTKIILYISILTLFLNTAISIILIKNIGIIGPAISTVFVTYITVIIYLLLIKKELRIEFKSLFPITSLTRTFIASIVTASLCFFVNYVKIAAFYQLIIGILAFAITYYLLGSFINAILPYDRQMIKSILQSLYKRAIQKL